MNSNHTNMRHPPFTRPWPPRHPYPPPCGFPNNHRFYPPPPHLPHQSVNNQFNPPCNPRLYPPMTNMNHSYHNQLPGIFPAAPPQRQSFSHNVQLRNVAPDMPPFDQHLKKELSRMPANSGCYDDHSNSQTCYEDRKSSLEVKAASSYDNLETSYKKPMYPELLVNQEHVNEHFAYDSHFIKSEDSCRESYIYSGDDSRDSWLSYRHNVNKHENNDDSNHKKPDSYDKKMSSTSSNIEKERSRNSSNESNRSRNVSKKSEKKIYPCNATKNLENCNHEKEKSKHHSHKYKQSRNCSSERKKCRNSSNDRNSSRNYSHESKVVRNSSSERKSRNHSHEKRKSKDQIKDVEKLRNDIKSFKNLKNEIGPSKNFRNEKSRNVSNERLQNFNTEKSKNFSVEKSKNFNAEKSKKFNNDKQNSKNVNNAKDKSRSFNDEKERSRNERKHLETTNHKRKRERNCSTERNINSSCESKIFRNDSRESKRVNNSEKGRSRKERDKSSQKSHHKNSNRSQEKNQNSHSSQSLDIKATVITPENSMVNLKLENGDKHSNVKTEEENSSATKYTWIRSSPAELYYVRDENNPKVMIASQKLKDLHHAFESELVKRAEQIKSSLPKYEPPQRKTKLRKPKPAKMENEESSSTSEESSSGEEDTSLEELERKTKHPYRLHKELWYNDPGEMNDGPLCRCSAKARRSGIRHGIYAGESSISLCDLYSNNVDKLHHYRISITPTTNFLSDTPTTIHHDGHDFTFEGFSILSHFEIPELPHCKVIRFNIEYTILYAKEKFPENFTIAGLELFSHYLFTELLELVDLNWKAHDDSTGCHRFHLLPRFARDIEANGKELLSLNVILQYLLENNQLLIDNQNLPHIMSLSKQKWQELADNVKGMIVTCPGMKPSSIRVDQLDRELCNPKKNVYPEIVHFGVRPPQLSYAGNPNYQKAWRDYVKFRHLLANKPKVIYADRHRLLHKERRLQEMRMKNNLKRDVTVVISSEKFYKTGIMCDVVQHAMLLPVLICHLRFHQSLDVLEEKIGYKFKDRYLLQLALTHPSYRENFGTNPDHARNSLTNCGIRQPEYGDRRIHYMNTRKRGINTLINIMSRFGRREETASRINHNERLEFLGDAVVEFLSSIHLFFMFSNLEEGGLATYRAAIVQNQHLAVLAKNLQLEKFMLYAHGSDLCHDLELRHAMANCFEALMGALFLDGGIDVADRVFSETLFTDIYLEEWIDYPLHPLQELEPCGDRKWIPHVPILQKLSKFEQSTGIEFTHIRLLARAMTHRSLGYNNLTMGSNQRLEFLGDTVLQLVASEYLYKYFPEHHEGHLSLLRSSLVNNRTQSVVCDDLGMVEYAIYPYSKVELKAKDRADLLEAFLGALYVDKDLGFCTKFCEVCFFPRLQDFIMNQEWNDPKSKLQQCCLTLRTMDGGEPDIPVYKVIECKGPTNTRVYSVAVYFRRRRLAVGSGHSIQQAEMSAAENALDASKNLFPQLDHQRRAIEKSLNQRKPSKRECRK